MTASPALVAARDLRPGGVIEVEGYPADLIQVFAFDGLLGRKDVWLKWSPSVEDRILVHPARVFHRLGRMSDPVEAWPRV